MKFSRYNTFQNHAEKILAHNAYKDAFLVLEPALYNLIETAKQQQQADHVARAHPQLYDALIAGGFLVDSKEDELEKVRNLMHQTDHNETRYELIINPTMNCNFKCWYCYETHIKGSKMSADTILRVQKFVSNTLSDNPQLTNFTLSWFGGEPLLYFDQVILPILAHAQKQAKAHGVAFSSGFTTNAYLIRPKMIEQFKTHAVKNLQITLDGNQSLHDTIRFTAGKQGSYKQIMRNIILLCQNQIAVTLRINFTKVTLASTQDILADLASLTAADRKFITLSFHQVWQDAANNLNDELLIRLKQVKAQGFKVNTGGTGGVQHSCYADKKNQATINYNAEVFKCTARDFTTANSEGILNEQGRIVWNDRQAQRMAAKLNNPPCKRCAILPVCGGGCSQIAFDNQGLDYCVYNFSEAKKLDSIKQRFLRQLT